MMCDREYLGESAPTFAEIQGTSQGTFPNLRPFYTTGYYTRVTNFRIVGREAHNLTRTIEEAIFIRDNDPSLNRNIGKYYLQHTYDETPFNIPKLKLE